MNKTHILLAIFNTLFFFVFGHHPQVQIQQGALRGSVDFAANNRSYYSFTGIPYAKPPLGSLRFEPPKPAARWTGVFDATKTHPICVQFFISSNFGPIVGEEDCLYLNVYTPKLFTSRKDLLPVMFFIHGGGLIEGTGRKDWYGPDYLVQKDVVVVVCNYRLGAFGFLSTGDTVLPGNIGLKDQALALQWIKDNIIKFGGDPNRITVFGESSGAFCSHSFMFSPLTKNKIKGVISQSGTVLSPWGFLSLDVAVQRSKSLATLVGCGHYVNTVDMVKCLKKVPVNDIMNSIRPLTEAKDGETYLFRPVIEPECEGSFITKHPVKLLKCNEARDVPFLSGTNSEDGSSVSGWILTNATLLDKYRKNFDEILPLHTYLHVGVPIEEQKRLSKEIREFYLQQNEIGNSTITEFTNLFTDRIFLHSSEKSLALHVKYLKQSAFNYVFSFKGSRSFGEFFYGPQYDFGVTHADDLIYLFKSNYLFPNYTHTERERRVSDFMVNLWVNFAYHGNPTPSDSSWKPYTARQENYYLIRNESDSILLKDLHKERIKFWTDLLESSPYVS